MYVPEDKMKNIIRNRNLIILLSFILFVFVNSIFAGPNEEGVSGSSNTDASVKQKSEPMIEVSVDIIEISNTKNNTLGISWNDSISIEEGLEATPFFNFNHSTPWSSESERGVASSFYKAGKFNRPDALIANLRMLIRDNTARILSNPKLATESGSQASFLVGGEIPVPVASPQGTSIEWKTYGINLQIRPDLIEKGKKISAMIQISISDLDYANAVTLEGYSVPALLNRSANSKATVKDGGTIVIAGLKHTKRNLVESRVPFLGSIPVLGWFFRQKETNDTEDSMVIFVTLKKIEEGKK